MHRFTTASPPQIVVEFRSGTIDIDAVEGATETTVVLTGDDGDGDGDDVASLIASTVIEQHGHEVRVLMPRRALMRRSPSLRLVVTTPTGAGLSIKSGSATITAHGEYGSARVDSGSGDVDIEHLRDAARITSGSGDVTVGSASAGLHVRSGSGRVELGPITGAASVHSGSGNLRLRSVTGDLKTNTGSGDITVGEAGEGVVAKTGSGDVTVDTVHRGKIKAHGASGDIRVGVAAGTVAWLDAYTVSGRVTNELDDADAPGDGEEQVRLQLNTVSGNIDVVRS